MQEASFTTPGAPATAPAAAALVDTDDLVFALGVAAVEKIGTGKQLANLRAALAQARTELDAARATAAAEPALREKLAHERDELLKRNAELAKKLDWQDQQRLSAEALLCEERTRTAALAAECDRLTGEMAELLSRRRKRGKE